MAVAAVLLCLLAAAQASADGPGAPLLGGTVAELVTDVFRDGAELLGEARQEAEAYARQSAEGANAVDASARAFAQQGSALTREVLGRATDAAVDAVARADQWTAVRD